MALSARSIAASTQATLDPPVARGRRSLLMVGLVAVDVLALAAAFGLAYVVRFTLRLPGLQDLPPRIEFYAWVALLAVPIWIGLLAAHRLYDRRFLFAGFGEYHRVVNTCTVGVIALLVISLVDMSLVLSRGWLLLIWALSIVLLSSGRFGVRRTMRALHAHGQFVTPIVIVGANAEGVALAEQFLGDPGCGARIVGFLDASLARGTHVVGDLDVLGGPGFLDQLISHGQVREVVIASSALSREQLLDFYWRYGQEPGLDLRMSSGLFEILTTGMRVQELGSVPLVTPERLRITGAEAVFKTLLDYALAIGALTTLLPLLIVIGLLVKLEADGPVLHRRRVMGVGGRTFDALKFRTMVTNADEVLARDPELWRAFQAGFKLKSDPRVTRLGRLLRRTSLDELPQLWNVVRGEMSLVGPRIIAPEEAARYGKWQRNLVTVKPGITGPWQVRGRGDLAYEQRVKLSMQYIRNYSLWLDVAILLQTVGVVVRGKGAY